MSIFSKTRIKDFIIYGLGQSINILSPLIVLPYLIVICGVEEVGKIGIAMSIALILNGIIDYGSYVIGVKEISINRDNLLVLEEKFTSIYISKVFLFILIFLTLSLFIFFLPYLSKDKTLFFFSTSIILGQLLNPAWYLQGIENFKWISILNILSKLIYLALIFIFIRNKEDYIYANLFLGIGAIVSNTIGLIWLKNQNSFEFKAKDVKPSIAILKEEFSFSLSQFFLSLYQFFPIIIIGFIGGDLMAGQYRIIDQIITIFKTYFNMFFYFVFANICYVLNQNYKEGIRTWKQYNGFNLLMILIIVVIFYLLTPVILSYFKFDENEIIQLSSVFKFALIIPILTGISISLRQLMFAFNLNNIYITITILATLISFVLLASFTKLFALKGAFSSIILIELIIIILYSLFITFKHKEKS